MPGPRIVKDENLAFLYLCLVNSDYTLINYPPIAAHLGIKPPAARMRFFRLKKAIEQSLSTLGGKADGGATTASTKQKRKRVDKHGDDDECCGEKARLAAKIKAECGNEGEGTGCRGGSAQKERGVKRRCSSPAARVKLEERSEPVPQLLARGDGDGFDGAVAKKRGMEQDTTVDAERERLRSEEDGFAIKDTFGFLEPLWPGPYACYEGFEYM